MILITLLGGLGNQMFQYAFGRALAKKLNSELFLDLSSFNKHTKDTQRTFELNYFPIQAKIASKEDLKRVIPENEKIRSFLKSVQLSSKGMLPITIIRERKFNFDPDIFYNSDNSNFIGYWQSEKYFSNISSLIKKEFSFILPLTSKNENLIQRMESNNSVSLHIRRGDYISNPEIKKYHGICSIEYYQKALSIIEEKIPGNELYIFSDDPQWARMNISSPSLVTVVDWNNEKPHDDLRLMASCKHHIIANSSFSWWGAWLGKSDNQIVIAPEPWFNNKDINTSDLYIDNWIRIPKNEPE
jgi:hypothetical protein